MKPVEFPHSNVVFGKDQPEYHPLPACKEASGKVTSCWKLTWRERFKLLLTGKIYCSQLTFYNKLQPQLLSLEFKPEE